MPNGPAEQKDTQMLFNEIKNARSRDEFKKSITDNLPAGSLTEYLARLLEEKKLKKAEVVTRSELDKSYAYHIFSGEKRPSRQKALALALSFGLTVREANYLLYFAGTNQLNPRSTWDKVILYALDKHWSVHDTNIFLDEVGEAVFLE